MPFDLSNYEAVEDRIDKFYKSHANGRILTEIHLLDATQVIFKALIYLGDELVATGFAMEKEGSSPVNKTSHIENAETSAIGRALANYNYAKKGARPSKEEMRKVVNNQEKIVTPVNKPPQAQVKSTDAPLEKCSKCSKGVGGNVATFSKDKFGSVLCMDCQKIVKT